MIGRRWLVVCAILASPVCGAAQGGGSIRGMVTDRDFGAPLAAVSVMAVELDRTTTTNDQGTFVLTDVPAGRHTLVFSKAGYARYPTQIVLPAGQQAEVQVAMSGEIAELEPFVVQDLLRLDGSSEAGLLQVRFDSAALIDSIGADLIGRAAATDAAGALRLVAGATVQDGKGAVIRGLPDRYVSSQLNGIRLPSADADKRAVELDQFPAAAIESVRVSKTFTPDQQGDASGGAVDVRLKGVPDQPFFLQWKAQSSYDSQVTGRSRFLTYDGGGVHFLGRDGGGRAPQLARLEDDWAGAVGTSRAEAPLDYKASAAMGGRLDLGGGLRLGGFTSLFYERDSTFFDRGRDDSWWVENPGAPMTPRTSQGTVQEGDFKTSLFDVTQGSQQVQWGNLSTVGLQSDRHQLNLVYLYTRTAEDKATLAEDTRGKAWFFPGHDPAVQTTPGHASADAAPYLRLETLEYTERTTETVQFTGRHRLSDGPWQDVAAAELDWSVSRSTAGLDQPDKRQFGELWRPGRVVGPFSVPSLHLPYKPAANFTLGNLQRIYQTIDETSEQYAVDLKLPFEQWSGDRGYLKVGIFDDRVSRRFDQDTFSNFNDNSNFAGPFQQHWSSVFPLEPHPITESDFDVDYSGRQRVAAWYAMLDLPLWSGLNVIGGARFESTRIRIRNDAEDGATWFPPGSLAPTQLNPGDADVDFGQHDALPAVALVWRPWQRWTLRASYAETVARQTFKEITPILQQEYLGGPVFIGNPDLQMSAVKNYDLRLDWAPYDGGLVSVSWFQKDVQAPIEYVQRIGTFDFTTAVNYPFGRLAGWELETRQDLGWFWGPLGGLAVGANATLIDSSVDLPEDEIEAFRSLGIAAPERRRDMTNAPEHLYNLYCTYDLEVTGTQLGVFYTVQGDSLVSGAAEADGNFVPDIYLTGFDTLNATLSQSLGAHVRLQLGVKNLTNPEIREVYRSREIGDDVTRTSFTRGVEYTLGIGGEVRF